jgi:DnaK suppressor protein
VSPRTLDPRTMGELEQFLRDELMRLQDSLRAIAQETRLTEKTALTDVTAHAAETLHSEIQVALVDRRTRQVAQIHDALQRLSAGRYGFCQECDAFVGVARLRALPFAQRCRDCQGHAERRARRETPAALGREGPLDLETEAA